MPVPHIFDSHNLEGLSDQILAALTPGDPVVYDEDGYAMNCIVTENTSTSIAFSFRLRVESIAKTNDFYKDATIGEEFAVYGAKGYRGYWGWTLRPYRGTIKT